MREQQVDGGRHRQWPQRLQGQEIVEVGDDLHEVAEVVERKVGNPEIAVKRRRDHIAVAREYAHRSDVVAGDRAAAVAVGKQQHRKAAGRVRPQRRVGAALHVRHDPAGGQRVVGARIGGRSRMAYQHDVLHGPPGE